MLTSLLSRSKHPTFSKDNKAYKLTFLIIILLLSSFVNAQPVLPQKQWDKTLGGANYDNFTTMIATPDGGYLLGGNSWSEIGLDKSEPYKGGWDFWVVKIDKDGKKQWDRTFGGKDDDEVRFMVSTSDGGYLIGGNSLSGIGGDKSESNRGGPHTADYWIVKVDKNGNKLWDKTYGGNATEFLYVIITLEDGGYLLAGSSGSELGGDKTAGGRYWMVKIDKQGAKEWDKGYDADLYKMVPTLDGGYLLGGSSALEIGGYKTETSRGGTDFWVLKVDKDGHKQWDRTFGGNGQEGLTSIVATADGGYLLGGGSESGIGGDKSEPVRSPDHSDFWIVKIDRDGNKMWDKTYGGDQSETITSIVLTLDGGYLLGGYSFSGKSGDKSEPNRGDSVWFYDFWIVRVDSSGKKLWDKTFGGSYYDDLEVIVNTQDGGYLLGGSSSSPVSGDKSEPTKGTIAGDYWIVKLGPDIVKQDQLIAFDSIPNYTVGNIRFRLSAKASSGLPVSFRVVSGPASLAADTVTLTGAGLVTIEASQAGNALYNPAPTVTRSFAVTPRSSILITSFSPGSGPAGTVVLINGVHLGEVRSVRFNGVNADFTVVHERLILAIVPPGATTGPISMNDLNGLTASSTTVFRITYPKPAIAFFTPNRGPANTLVTIVGANFGAASAVWFNGVATSYFRILSPFVIEATVPSGANTGRISVLTPGGSGSSLYNFIVSKQRYANREMVPEERIMQEGVNDIYPNPFHSYFTIRNLPLGGNVPVTLYTVDGKVVLKKQAIVPGQRIDVENLIPPGMYILRVGAGQDSKQYKVMKTN